MLRGHVDGQTGDDAAAVGPGYVLHHACAVAVIDVGEQRALAEVLEVAQLETVGELGVQVRVAAAYVPIVGQAHEGQQIAEVGAAYAQAVAQLQGVALVDLVRHMGRWEEVEILPIVDDVLFDQRGGKVGEFAPNAPLQRKAFELGTGHQIGGIDILLKDEIVVEVGQGDVVRGAVLLRHQIVVVYSAQGGAQAGLELHLFAKGMHIVGGDEPAALALQVVYALQQGLGIGEAVLVDVGCLVVAAHKIAHVGRQHLFGGGKGAPEIEVGLDVLVDGLLVLEAGHHIGHGIVGVQVGIDEGVVVELPVAAVHARGGHRGLRIDVDVGPQAHIARHTAAQLLAGTVIGEGRILAYEPLERVATARTAVIADAQPSEEVHLALAVVDVERATVVVGPSGVHLKRAVESRSAFLLQHNVDDARLALGIVAGRGVGHYLHPLYDAAGQLAQRIGRADAREPRWFAVYKDAHILTAPQVHVAVHIHAHRGDVVKDVLRVAACVGGVFGHVEHPAVQHQFHLVALGRHHHLVHQFGLQFQGQCAQVHVALCGIHIGYALVGIGEERYGDGVDAGLHAHLKLAIKVGGGTLQLGAFLHALHGHGSVGDGHSVLVCHLAAYRAAFGPAAFGALRHEGRGHQ